MTNILRSGLAALTVALAALFSLSLSSCGDHDPEVRTEADLVGVWTDAPDRYLYIKSSSRIYSLRIYTHEGEEVGMLEPDGYLYEPGYNFVVYIDRDAEPNIYKLIKLTDEEMVWCWVDNLSDDKYEGMSASEVLGQLLKEADKGFKLDYSKTVTFRRVPFSDFEAILHRLGLEL